MFNDTGPREDWAVQANTPKASFAERQLDFVNVVQNLHEDSYFPWGNLPPDVDFHFGNVDAAELAWLEMDEPM
jgi:hypothetical protein